MLERAVVTGAFSYTGRRIATRLLERRVSVTTLTAHPARAHSFGDRIEVRPLDLTDLRGLVSSLEGARVLYNTYWVRFDHAAATFDRAIQNSLTLFEAARIAGVERIVHVSITNPELGTGLPYFEGKAVLEDALRASHMTFGIVRPTVMFGHGDVFINNIAWLLRRLPFFMVPGDGAYRLQPVFVDDVAELCLDVAGIEENVVVDAAGPDVFTFAGLVGSIRDRIGAHSFLLHVPPSIALLASRVIGPFVRDVVLTRGELDGLMRELIVSRSGSPCSTSLRAWLDENADTLGVRYASELARNYDVSSTVMRGSR